MIKKESSSNEMSTSPATATAKAGRLALAGGSFGIGWPVFNSVINGNTNYGQTIIFGNE
ncbi:hypothetical protein [Ekhidna sp. To15]|uniref:hypothetical protein n=1 Tax=Ekhidna sp. To15 TaxID=3395267 RepID=UPI003F524CD8